VRDRLSRFTLVFGALATLAACSGGGGGSPPAPVPTVSTPVVSPSNPAVGPTGGGGGISTPGPSPTAGFNAAAFVCPTADSTVSIARAPASDRTRRAVSKMRDFVPAEPTLEVTYANSAATRSDLSSRVNALGARSMGELTFASLGRTTRIVAAGSANVDRLAASLRAQPGVLSVSPGGARRAPLAVTTPYYPNDPYFNGFATPVDGSAATFHVAPYSESATVPGQWNLHAIGLEYALGYSQSGNGSGTTNPAALGSAATRIAIIDTGADTAIPELSGGKVGLERCFITNPLGVTSTSNFVTDPDGHGTDVAAIAASNTNNLHGFTGTGGNATIDMYRVDPTPDDNCLSSTNNDPQCSADVADVAAAINDAVAQRVNIISLSLGGGGCTNGVDGSALEQQAVTNALDNNIIVVVSSGNGATFGAAASTQQVSAPACINGVIAVGATALADGVVTGTGTVMGSATAPLEYVASYSDYGTPGAAFRSAAAWGIVAPGGDPAPAEANPAASVDDLHWIEDAWTGTPATANFAGNCRPDYPGTVQADQAPSCRTLIAGTSMSAPTVAGAAALILSVNPSYQSPARMKQLLCATADDLNDPREGCGRLNVNRAMASALNDPKLP